MTTLMLLALWGCIALLGFRFILIGRWQDEVAQAFSAQSARIAALEGAMQAVVEKLPYVAAGWGEAPKMTCKCCGKP